MLRNSRPIASLDSGGNPRRGPALSTYGWSVPMWRPHWAPQNGHTQTARSNGPSDNLTTATRQRQVFFSKKFVSLWYLASWKLSLGKGN